MSIGNAAAAGGSGRGWLETQQDRSVHRSRREAAFSLIEMIGLMAVLTILSLALVPALIRGYDRLARDREDRALETLSEGLRTHVLRFQEVPHPTNFPGLLAVAVGWREGAVLTNSRGQARRFLVDPAVTNTLPIPFTQTQMGVAADIEPALGIILMSSVGEPLPAGILTGLASSTAAFSNIWNAPEGSIPAGWVWSGRGEDLRIRRLALDNLFVPLVLNYGTILVAGTNQGRFTIGNSTTNILPTTPSFSASYIKGTVLGLHHHAGTVNTLQVREVLQHPVSFAYEGDAWRGQLFLGRGLRLTSGLDLQAAHDVFVASPLNVNAKGNPQATPVIVVNTLSNYMKNFVAWRDAGYPAKHATRTAVSDSQTAMKTASVNLLHKPEAPGP
ncbi:MAG: type II secretion system protein [Verrucomicrobiae bacterium]|nr:type II secretion system protein [Verrucomicrobiae bacterium]